jgi:predicted Zn-ribbon and HTH transcriptional regulator
MCYDQILSDALQDELETARKDLTHLIATLELQRDELRRALFNSEELHTEDCKKIVRLEAELATAKAKLVAMEKDRDEWRKYAETWENDRIEMTLESHPHSTYRCKKCGWLTVTEIQPLPDCPRCKAETEKPLGCGDCSHWHTDMCFSCGYCDKHNKESCHMDKKCESFEKANGPTERYCGGVPDKSEDE